jgi:membrane protein YdbS with pleckstrin-like domain
MNLDGGTMEREPASTPGVDQRLGSTIAEATQQVADQTRRPRLRPPKNRVSPRAIWYWAVRALASWIVVVVVQIIWLMSAADNQHTLHLVGLAATGVIALVHVIVMPQWRYRVHRWEVTPQAMYTQAGWLHQEQRIAPVSRIQTIDSERGVFEQMFDLANLTVTTASAAGPLKIHGLDYATAQALVDQLTADVQATTGDAT